MLDLERHIAERHLVTLQRDAIDVQAHHGYVLAASADLLVLQYVDDFRLDGLRVLRVADVTDIGCSDADRFQRSLMVAEGVEQAVPFGKSFDLRSWQSVIAQLCAEFGLLAAECETGDEEQDDFVIGRLVEAGADSVSIRYFDGLAEWMDEPVALDYSEITCCQFDSNYLNVYRRHFERAQG